MTLPAITLLVVFFTSGVLMAQGVPLIHSTDPAVRAAVQACTPDIKQFCGQVKPGQGRLRACMTQHRSELSQTCVDAIFQAWLHRQ